ncbi:MAG TPA: DoxX family protein [Gemmatimonadaceae bacterium]|jgi:putative oxidoreductase|nr:DoxX family protein [Gemmatimonadaceae bacterium]
MSFFRAPSARQLNLGLAVLRVAVATIFIRHGAQKLFVFGFAGVTGAFTHMGIPLPGFTGPFIGLLEFFGGIALLLGLLTRPIALLFVFDMLFAILLVKLKGGFSGYELELLLCASSLALFLTGGGSVSVDALLGRRASTNTSSL